MELGAGNVGNSVFKNLFELDPNLLKLFKFGAHEDYEEQQDYINHISLVIDNVTQAVNHLGDMDSLVDFLKQLGGIHIPKGVKEEDYDTLGSAIMTSLKEVLDTNFTYALERAWEVTYSKIKAGVIADNYENL